MNAEHKIRPKNWNRVAFLFVFVVVVSNATVHLVFPPENWEILNHSFLTCPSISNQLSHPIYISSKYTFDPVHAAAWVQTHILKPH